MYKLAIYCVPSFTIYDEKLIKQTKLYKFSFDFGIYTLQFIYINSLFYSLYLI